MQKLWSCEYFEPSIEKIKKIAGDKRSFIPSPLTDFYENRKKDELERNEY